MEPFIRNDQFNVIKEQANLLADSHSRVVDTAVLNALESMAMEKVIDVFPAVSASQKQLLASIVHVTGKEEAMKFINKIHQYLIPFPEITDQTLSELFPKAKKLKIPSIDKKDRKVISYLSWIDGNSSKKFLVAQRGDGLVGLQGTFTSTQQEGICTLCNSHEEIGMFVTGVSGKKDAYLSRGNYICKDSQTCNNNITTLENLNRFVNHVYS